MARAWKSIEKSWKNLKRKHNNRSDFSNFFSPYLVSLHKNEDNREWLNEGKKNQWMLSLLPFSAETIILMIAIMLKKFILKKL